MQPVLQMARRCAHTNLKFCKVAPNLEQKAIADASDTDKDGVLNSEPGEHTLTKNFPLTFAALMAVVAFATPSHAEDLVFTLTNSTNSTLERFYTSPVGVDAWEEDVLGQDVLEPGERVEITIADGRSVCDYDMRFEFSADSDLDTTEDTQDLCELGSYEIHE